MSDTILPDLDADQPFDLEHESLDSPKTWGIDWGGDGSDLSRPVRAHVLQALRPNEASYPPPVDALRQIGNADETDTGIKRAALGLTQEHLPDLLRMARDRAFHIADSDSDEVWAPVHAFYTLFELDISAVIPELIPLFDVDEDRLRTNLPELLGEIGAPALEPLRSYLADPSRWAYGHMNASKALEEIARQHPELREEVVAILSDVLRNAEQYYELSITGVMDHLVELDAVEALPLIRRAFEIGKIDEMVRGPWGDVLHDFGFEPEDDDPLLDESRQRFVERQNRIMSPKQRADLQGAFARLAERWPQNPPAETSASAPMSLPLERSRPAQPKPQKPQNKAKNKRKAASASRKANRKRK